MVKRPHRKAAYVVFRGRQTGVFETWEDCEQQVHKFPGQHQRGYNSVKEAEEAWEDWLNPLNPLSNIPTNTNFEDQGLRKRQRQETPPPPPIPDFVLDISSNTNHTSGMPFPSY